MQIDDRPIGIFDSGIGGLSVARSVARELPRENLIYVGDTARVPYGDKSPDQLIVYARQILDFLVGQGVKAIVAACNTSCSVSIPFLLDKYSIPIIEIIKPGAREVPRVTSHKRVGVLATLATARSGAYRRAIQALSPDIEVWEVACPGLVPLIEAGHTEGPEVEEILMEYLRPLQENKVDTIVLGCTHYPYLVPVIEKLMPGGIAIVDPAVETVVELQKTLAVQGTASGEKGYMKFYATGSEGSFYQAGRLFMGPELDRVTRIKLDD